MSPVCEQDAFFPFCLYHCLFSARALTDRCLRLANAMCVCLNLHGLQLKMFVMSASGSCTRHAQWCEAEGGERAAETKAGERQRRVESMRDKGRKGICVHGELSKDSPSTSAEWEMAVHWYCGWNKKTVCAVQEWGLMCCKAVKG